MGYSDNEVIKKIASGGEGEILELYNKHKKHFISWAAHKFSLGETEALDVFQDTMIAFYKSIRQGRLTELDYALRTYLYSIAKNIILTRLKRDKRDEYNIDDYKDLVNDPGLSEYEEDIRTRVVEALEKMKEPCYTLLRLYYYDGYSLEAIAREINSKNANVVKAQKTRCIKALKEIIEKEERNKTNF